jgi:hypothetical protein
MEVGCGFVAWGWRNGKEECGNVVVAIGMILLRVVESSMSM